MPHIHEKYDYVVSVFVTFQNKILLVYHKKYQEWLPLGGHIEMDEDPLDAVYREIQEESGLEVELFSKAPNIAHPGVKPIPTPDFVDVHDISLTHRHIAFIYFGQSHTDQVVLHEREHREFAWFAVEELASPKLRLVPSILFYCQEAMKAAREYSARS